jgi:Ca2+/Na+ antiporter
MIHSLTLFLSLLLLLSHFSNGRLIANDSIPASDLVSDGVNHHPRQPSMLQLNPYLAAEDTCEQTYGFMPCTTTALGNLFLLLVYGYLMYFAATCLSGGSELLLEILGPGIIGGLFLPTLGALPDALLILVSGLSGDTVTAQSQVSVGMGLLAGSTVMLLTVIWGTCVVVGKCDIQDGIAIDGKDTKRFNLTESGVCTDIWTTYAAMIMAVSVIPFIIVQLLQAVHSTSGRHLAVLIALILSFSLLLSYCVYQVFQPWIQRRRLAYAKHKHVISGILKHLDHHEPLAKFLNEEGATNEVALRRLFDIIDLDKDGYVSSSELRALIVGIQFEQMKFDQEDAAGKVMKDFDKSGDDKISFPEFSNGLKLWLEEVKNSKAASADHFHKQTRREHELLGGTNSDEVQEGVEDPKWTSFKAALLLLLGSVIAAVFADPLVDAVDNFSNATKIPSFFISFIALPIATNSSEAVSAIIFASRKNLRSASLTFSELYGAVTMNNVLCLSVFLGLVYARGLEWNFSSEVLVIVIVCVLMGAFSSFRTTFPLWTAIVAFSLYPFSLALVYVLDYVFGWS